MTPPPPPPPVQPATVPGRGASQAGLRRGPGGILADRGYAAFAAFAAFGAVILVAYLLWVTLGQTTEAWSAFGVIGFIFGSEWAPFPVSGAPVYGALPFIYGTLMTSLLALTIAVPVAVMIALATTVFLPRRLRGPLGGLINLLAAIPSVIFGLWGLFVLIPWLTPFLNWMAGTLGWISIFGWQPFAGPVTSGSFLVSGVVLAVMVLPIITAITREVLLTVPRDQQEAAYALGATRWEMVKHSMLPWARSGIVGASALGLGRAVGETIAIAMLLGNSAVIFGSLLGPGATLASVIALETGEATGLQLSALTALAVVLFVVAFVINGAARIIVRRSERQGTRRRGSWIPGRRQAPPPVEPAAPPPVTAMVPEPEQPRPPLRITGAGAVSRSRQVRSRVAEVVIRTSLLIGIIPLVAIFVEMLIKGIPAITPGFFTEVPPADPATAGGGIANALIGTLILMGLATLFSAPFAILTALFISDVTRQSGWQKRLSEGIGFFVDVMLGVPAIVIGLIVFLGIVLVQGSYSAIAGGIALGLVMFPIIVRSADEILRLVPHGQKEAAYALGAPKWRTTASIVLPAAAPGILTGIILALARAAGETAPLLFTSLGNQFISTDLNEPIAAIPQFIYDNTIRSQTEASLSRAWGAALTLIVIILVLTLIASLISRKARPLEGR
jgi:phosphate transport system permease protein